METLISEKIIVINLINNIEEASVYSYDNTETIYEILKNKNFARFEFVFLKKEKWK